MSETLPENWLILDAEHYDPRALLRGPVPPGAVLGTLFGTSQRACIQAKMVLLGEVVPPGKAAGGFAQVLLLNPDHPADQQRTKLYAQRWLETAYAYRVPCGNWKTCGNPEGPATVHYAPPSKNPDRAGPALCRFCRLGQGPSQLCRERTAASNRKRAKKAVGNSPAQVDT